MAPTYLYRVDPRKRVVTAAEILARDEEIKKATEAYAKRRAAKRGQAGQRAYERRLLEERGWRAVERGNRIGTPLTKGQVEILRLKLDGLTNAEISKKLGIAQGTVTTQIRRSCGKLGVTDAARAVKAAVTYGLIAPAAGSDTDRIAS